MPDVAGKAAVSDDFQPRVLEGNVVVAAKGVAVVFAGRLLSIPQRLVLGVLLARLLGAEQYGLYNLALSAAAIAGTVALLGLDTGLVRYVSAFASRRDTVGLSGVLRLGAITPAVFSTFCGLALIVLASPLADRMFHEPRVIPLLQLIGLAVPFIALNDILAAATRGFKNQRYTVVAKFICQPFVKIAALLALAIIGLDAKLAIAASMTAEIATTALLLYFLNRQFPLRRLLGTSRVNVREMFEFSLPVYLSAGINVVTANIQALVLAASGAVSAVGVYAVASQASSLSRPLMSSITTASMPIISEFYEQGDRRHLKDFYQITTKWSFTLNLPLLLIVVMFPRPLLAVFGDGFMEGALALTILAWASLIKIATGTNGPVLDMTGYTKLKLLNSIVTAITTIGLNILLVPRIGIIGAAMAVFSGNIVVETLRLLEVYIALRILPYNTGFLKPIAAGLAAFSGSWAIGYLAPDLQGYVAAVLGSAVMLCIYGGVILALGLNPEDRMLWGRLRQRIKLGLRPS